MRELIFQFSCVAALVTPVGVEAQVRDQYSGAVIPSARHCTARHIGSGMLVQVRQRATTQQGWAWAISNWDPDGWPVITYYSGYLNLPPLMQLFSTAHECGHLVMGSTDEIAANCFAVANLGLTRQQLQFVGNFHIQLGSIGSQYGGTGAAFWSATMQRCPQFLQ